MDEDVWIFFLEGDEDSEHCPSNVSSASVFLFLALEGSLFHCRHLFQSMDDMLRRSFLCCVILILFPLAFHGIWHVLFGPLDWVSKSRIDSLFLNIAKPESCATQFLSPGDMVHITVLNIV